MSEDSSFEVAGTFWSECVYWLLGCQLYLYILPKNSQGGPEKYIKQTWRNQEQYSHQSNLYFLRHFALINNISISAYVGLKFYLRQKQTTRGEKRLRNCSIQVPSFLNNKIEQFDWFVILSLSFGLLLYDVGVLNEFSETYFEIYKIEGTTPLFLVYIYMCV